MADWITPAQGLAFVRITAPTPGEQLWADNLAPAISAGIDNYLDWPVPNPITRLVMGDEPEIVAAAQRAFGYAWKYREAPFGEAQWLDEQGGAVRLAKDWLDPIKPILNRYRNAASVIA